MTDSVSEQNLEPARLRAGVRRGLGILMPPHIRGIFSSITSNRFAIFLYGGSGFDEILHHEFCTHTGSRNSSSGIVTRTL